MTKKFSWIAVGLSLMIFASLNLTMVSSIAPSLFTKQLFAWILGLGLFFLGRFLNPKQLSAYQWPIFIFSILLLISPLVIGNFIRGSRRWLSLGPINLQPSEITKPLLMIFIATSSQPLFHLAAVLLIALEPDLGSALSVLILLTPVILTNRRILKISLLILIIGLVLSPFIWQHVLKDYQRQRLTTFINPQTNPLDGGYHVIQSKIAIGSGGFWGKGYKKGTQGQLLFLPEKHTDFIFAATAEELGLAAVILILIAYFLLSSSLLNHAYSLSDNRPLFIFNLGIFFLIWFQFFVNIGMNLGIMPVTGIPLPFLSVGTSSLISFLFSLGICFSD